MSFFDYMEHRFTEAAIGLAIGVVFLLIYGLATTLRHPRNRIERRKKPDRR